MVKKQLIKFFPIFLSLAAFLVVLLMLISTPKVVTLAESRINSTNQIPTPLPQNQAEVAGVAKQPIITLRSKNIATPSVSAYGLYVLDLDIQQPLLEKNSRIRLAMASTTKIMTALIAAAHFKAGQVLTVPAAALVGGSTMGLQVGEVMTFRSLLYGMLLNSGNDAAFTLALNYPGGLSNFIVQMNKRSEEMGLKDTHFQNPAGFDDPTHFTSAYDMAKIAEVFSQDPVLAKVVSTKDTSVVSFDKTRLHDLHNLNKLLGVDGVVGIKTGTTEKSGENLVTLTEKDNHRVLIVVLNSADRFGETKRIIDWLFQNYSWNVSE